MDVMEKLAELVHNARINALWHNAQKPDEYITDMLIDDGVTVHEHGYWETVVEVKENTVCGNGVKIEYKRCSCCKNPAKFFEDDFCGYCGARLDLEQPQKGE